MLPLLYLNWSKEERYMNLPENSYDSNSARAASLKQAKK
jgi:hypothetical protein